MNRLDSILRNAVFSFIARGIDVSVTFVLAVILARYLGPEGMGEYAYIIAFVAVFVPLVDLGLDHILIREIAQRREAARQYVGAALLLKLLIIFVLLPAGMAAFWAVGDRSVDSWAIFLCFVGILILREIPTVVGYAVFLAYERMEYRAVVTLLFQIVKFSATLIVILLGWKMVAIFAAALLGELVQGVIAIYLVFRRFTRPRLVLDLKLWKYYIIESWPLAISFAFTSLYFQIDILILKHFRTAEETGIFGVPFRVITTLFSVLIPMIWVLLPHLARAAKDSIARLRSEGQGYLKGIIIITAGLSLYLMLESRDLVINIFGIEYEKSVFVMAMIAPVITFHAFNYFFDLTLMAVGRQKYIIYSAGTAFLVKLIVDLIFVPRYGVNGAAYGTISSDLACFIVLLYLTRRYVTSFNLRRIVIRPLGAAAAAGLLLWFTRIWPFYVTVFVFGLSYIAFIWLFRVVSPDQQRVFFQMTNGLRKKFGMSREESEGSDDIG